MELDPNYLQNFYLENITFGGLYGRKDKRIIRF